MEIFCSKRLSRSQTKVFLIVAILMIATGISTPLHAATITSNATGGTWSLGTTWVGGVVPATTDNVVIATTGSNVVTVGTSTACVGLTVNSGSILSLGTRTLTVTGSLDNSGTINISTGRITMSGTGNLTNSGTITYTGAGRLTLVGSLTNTGTLTLASAGIYFAGTNAAASTVDGFTTTGLISYTRTAGSTTFTGNVGAAAFTLSATGGTLNLGTLLTHTFTGLVTLTAGTLDGGSSTLNVNFTGGTAWSRATACTFTPSTGTVRFGGNAQTIAGTGSTTFNNLTFAGSGAKTLTRVPTINGIMSMEGTATLSASPTLGTASTIQYKGTSTKTMGVEFPNTFNGSGGVIIDQAGYVITVNANKTALAGDLHLVSGTLNMSTFTMNRVSAGGTFSIASGATLRIGGTNTLPANYSTHSIDAASTIEYYGTVQTITAPNSSQNYGNLLLSTGTTRTFPASPLTIAGTLTTSNTVVATAAANLTVDGTFTIGTGSTFNAGSYTHSLGGNFANSGTFTAGTSTVDFTASGAQAISGTSTTTFNNLTLSGSGLKTFTTRPTVNGIFSMEGTADASTYFTQGTAPTIQYKGSTSRSIGPEFLSTFSGSGGIIIDQGVGNTVTLNENKTGLLGNLNIVSGTFDLAEFTANRSSAGGTLTLASGATLKIGGGNTFPSNYSTHSISTGSTVEYDGTTQAVGSLNSSQGYGNLILSGSGTKTLPTLVLYGNYQNNGTTVTSTGTLSVEGTSPQSIGGTTTSTFNNLTLSNTAGVTFEIDEAIGGTFTVGSGVGVTAGSYSHTIGGDFVNNSSSFDATGSTFTFNGGTAQTISGTAPIDFNNFTVSNALGVTLSTSQTVNGILNFTSGLITTGSNTLTLGCSGSMTNTSSARYVNGKLALVFCSSGSKVFHIGKGGNYRPITLNYTALTGTSTVTAEQFESLIPGTIPDDITPFSSRYWQLSQTGGSSYSFLISLDGTGWSPTNYIKMLKGDGSSNVHHGLTTPNYTNSTAFTSFGNFGLGELSYVTWLGASSDWFSNSNWTSESPPTSSDEIHIPSPSTFYPSIGGTSPGNDITVSSSGILQIENGASLTVESGPLLTFDLGATVTTGTGSKITLQSGSRYLNLSSSTPTLEAQRELTSVKGWRMLSSPVKGDFADLFAAPLVTQGFTGSSFPSLQPNLLWWLESDGGTSLQSWRKPSNASDSLVAGRGYFHYTFNGAGRLNLDGSSSGSNYTDVLPATMSVTGTEHYHGSGTYDFNLTYTTKASTQTPSPTDTIYYDLNALDQGWNLIGNPTASTLDWDAVGWTKTNVDNTIYVWDPEALSGNGDFLTWNGTVGTLGSGRIPPFQAFWTHATAATTLSFTNAVKTGTTGTFLRNAEVGSTISLPITLSVGGLQTTSFLSFSEHGAIGPDSWDGYRLEPMSDVWLELYSNSSPQFVSPLVINHLPILKIKDELFDIPLHYNAQLSGNDAKSGYTLQWTLPDNWPSDWEISLQDHQREQAVSMRETTSYAFTAPVSSKSPSIQTMAELPTTPVLRSTERNLLRSTSIPPFSILVSKGKSIDYMAPKPELLGNFPNPFQKMSSIRFSLPQKANVQLDIYSLQGKKVASLANGVYPTGITEVPWDAKNNAPGMYFIRFQSGDSVETKKAVLIQ